MNYELSKEVKNSLHIAEANAKGYFNDTYGAAHLLRAILHKEIGLRSFIEQIDGDIYYIEEWSDVRMESLPRTSKIQDSISGDSSIESVFNEADMIKLKLGLDEITPICILAALCTPGVGFSYEQLKTLPITREQILNASDTPKTIVKAANQIANGNTQKVDTSVLSKYCIDKTTQARNQKLQKIYCRDAEIKMIVEILGRHSKPNVLIIGEPGVGKTALLNGFAQVVINEHVPDALADAQIYELDYIELVSGASYNGEVEDRFKKIIAAIKEFHKPIFLIDELHNITDKDSPNKGLINILKSELAKGEITILATVTNDAYRKNIENNETLSRRFEEVRLEEPSEKEALKMIENTISTYSKHHNLDVTQNTIKEAIRLSKRFNKDRSLPDSAIDLLDRTMSACKYMVETTETVVTKIEEEIIAICSSDVSEHKKYSALEWIYDNLTNRLSYLLFTAINEEDFKDKEPEYIDLKIQLETLLNALKEQGIKQKDSITKDDVSSTIANKTGIPVGQLQANEKERLLAIEDVLKRRVIGQNYAVKTISEAVLESRSGLSKPGLPIGSFFFTGPTGTGKTELAKALAEFLFQTQDSIIRFDMSEFKEEHSAALLYGAPPGYVGYEEGGILVNKIRQKPYSIVLFDEIEKAHPSVFDIFLQILDEGKLNDRLGKTGDFSNAVILFTSNIGSEHVVKSFTEGSIPKSAELLELMGLHFRPEFLGRLTEIVPFAPITQENIVQIFNIQLKDLFKALEKQNITLKITEEAQIHLANKGFTPKYGARPLRGIIRNELRRPLSRMLITGKLEKGNTILVSIEDEKLKWKIEHPEPVYN
ncbi:ATP-dependent Clp protease ATP-binding subunit [uncultured Maribacter sp.]|uniref:ATP-dependent Clp protease ATP-binding subunit n=1 Tax=uncultured Maribacter sp. TaxID=431308 RepID=UPI002603CE8F|nr:ATP-dependent Clp protease ATP-binding subunit [uncultured Maribacter sp.]